MDNRAKMFVESLVKDGLSVGRAYALHYPNKGLSATEMSRKGGAIARRKDVKAYRIELQAKVNALAEIDASWLLLQYKKLYDFNISKFLNKEGHYDFSKATDEDWFCIQEYSNITKYSKEDSWDEIKVKQYSKKDLLDAMGKHTSVAAFQRQVEEASANDLVDALRTLAESLPT